MVAAPSRVPDGQVLSWEQFQALPEDPRVEYLDGRVHVSPSPDLHHQDISYELAGLLRAAVPATHGVVLTWDWAPAALPDGTRDVFTPDVMVYERSQVEDPERYSAVPALVVEVLSTNRGDDLVKKMTKYPLYGLPHYWVVDPRELTVATFVLDQDAPAFRPTRVLDPESPPADLGFAVATVRLDCAALLRR